MTEGPSRGVELRLALAMRGGVSLAVWIGGACAEIDELRRSGSSSPDPSDFWSPLLARSGYSAVSVDVLAGASAGGLNGVIYAASQIYGFPFSSMRQIWLDVGGTEAMVRRHDPSPSLFQGDDYFGAKLFESLHTLAAAATSTDERPPVIDLALSATLIEPVERPVPSPSDEQLIERRFASGFRFRQPAMAWTGCDFPAPNTVGFVDAMHRLAIAGRTTSSYPGAFEAAAMRSTRPEAFDGTPSAWTAGALIDVGGALLDRGAPRLQPDGGDADPDPVFVVADGGILDNIPIARALNAIAAAPADTRTARFLIYLQPGAARPSTSARARTIETRRDTTSVLRGAAAARIGTENINADIDDLESHNEAVGRAKALRLGVFRELTDTRALVREADRALATYVLSRANDDARRVFGLLSDPIGVLGSDPFPRCLEGTPISDAAWRSPIARWPSAERERLPAELASKMAGRAAVNTSATEVFTAGVKPLIRVVQLLIEWARFRENILPEAQAAEASRAKANLYGVLTFLRAAIDRPRELAWVAAFAASDPNESPSALACADKMPGLIDQLCRFPAGDIPTIVASLTTGGDRGLAEARDGALGRVSRLVVGRADLQGFEDIRLCIVDDVLVPIVNALRSTPLAADVPIEKLVEQGDPGAHLERVLAGPAGVAHTAPSEESKVADVLAALEVVCFPEFAAGLPGRRPITFLRLSSANRTPVAPAFLKVLEAASTRDLWWSDSTETAEQEGIHVDLKLAGNELANFSAFLVAEWRANDWLWGRLDAVPTLVDLLVTPHSIKLLVTDHTGADVVAASERALIPDDHPWRTILSPDTLARWCDRVRAEVAAVYAAEEASLPAVPIPAIRNTLIAQRQWQIISEELALPQSTMSQARALTPAEVLEEVRTGRFGSETMRDNDHREELSDRFGELAAAAANAFVWNFNQTRPGGRRLGARPAQLIRWTVANVARMGSKRLLQPASSSTPSKGKRRAAIAAAVAAIVALAVLGFVSNRSAFLIGLGVGLVVVIPMGLMVKRWLRKLFKAPVAPEPRAPGPPGDRDG